MEIREDDEILYKQVVYALSLCDPNVRLARQAKELSKSGKHREAAVLYRKILAGGEADESIRTSFGWELYRLSKELLGLPNPNFNAIRQNLNEYLRLRCCGPSLLHSCILQVASKVAGEKHLNMFSFAKIWGFGNLRDEDFVRYVNDEGESFPSLAERVVLQAGKGAAESGDPADLDYILPYVDDAVDRYPDNLWLIMTKARVLLGLGRNEDALAFGRTVTKAKINDYWAWELLGDICSATDLHGRLGCYCKALQCKADDKFTGKVRLKLAHILLDMGKHANAKFEIEKVVASRDAEGQRIPEPALRIRAQDWYTEADAPESNSVLYSEYSSDADALLFGSIPWVCANVGARYVVPGKEGKPKRRIFIATPREPIEVSILESKFRFRDLEPGDGINVKGELGTDNRYKVYLIEHRRAESRWDLFRPQIGVVDHVNREKEVVHFMVSKDVSGLVPFSDTVDTFQEGDGIAVRIAKFTDSHGTRYRVLEARATNEAPSTAVKRGFSDVVRAENGMGFTKGDIFIPPPLMSAHDIETGDVVSGIALLNFNRKRDTWGWKAVSVAEVQRASATR
jgi:hypothetical protein